MAYYGKIKKRIAEWVAADSARSAKMYDTFGTADVEKLCDLNIHRSYVFEMVARGAGATEKEIEELTKS